MSVKAGTEKEQISPVGDLGYSGRNCHRFFGQVNGSLLEFF